MQIYENRTVFPTVFTIIFRVFSKFDYILIKSNRKTKKKKVCQKKVKVNSHEDSTIPCIKRTAMLPKAPSDVYFLRLQLKGKSGVVSENLYIMGREENNYQALTSLPKANVEQQMVVSGESLNLTLHNRSKWPAVFIRLNLKGADGEQILPVTYSDNYLTLMPGEKRTISVSWNKCDARGQLPQIEITQLQSGR